MARPAAVAIVIRGALAGAAGTAAMDAFWQARRLLRPAEGGDPPRAGSPAPYRSEGEATGEDEAPWWEEIDGAGEWSGAPAPAQVGKRVYEGVTQRTLEARFARLTNAVVHWGYGMGWGGLFGLAALPGRRNHPALGVLFGATVWGSSYLLLPITGLYRPVWKYPPSELVPDLAAHLIYGTGTALAFALLSRERIRG